MKKRLQATKEWLRDNWFLAISIGAIVTFFGKGVHTLYSIEKDCHELSSKIAEGKARITITVLDRFDAKTNEEINTIVEEV